jgi:hypothetical protein
LNFIANVDMIVSKEIVNPQRAESRWVGNLGVGNKKKPTGECQIEGTQ